MKIVREKTPAMIQQLKNRKDQIRQKHISLLKKRKEENKKQSKMKLFT
jgi:hypothetical protein